MITKLKIAYYRLRIKLFVMKIEYLDMELQKAVNAHMSAADNCIEQSTDLVNAEPRNYEHAQKLKLELDKLCKRIDELQADNAALRKRCAAERELINSNVAIFKSKLEALC